MNTFDSFHTKPFVTTGVCCVVGRTGGFVFAAITRVRFATGSGADSGSRFVTLRVIRDGSGVFVVFGGA